MPRPFVTVLIDTFNHERFIEQAIVSVLEQDFSPSAMEVVVVDDGSTDRTAAVVQKFAPRVRYLWKPNGGQASAFNFSIPQARGEIVTFLDGDDWWAKSKLRTVVEFLEKNPGLGAVGHGYFEVDAGGRLLRRIVPEKTYFLQLNDREGAWLLDRVKGFLGASKVAIRRTVLERVLPVPEVLVYEADEFIWTLVVALSGAAVLDQPLLHYRFHESNLFMARHSDEQKARRRYRVLAGLLEHLPPRMKELGVAPELISAALASLQSDAEVLRLSLHGGKPWETFRAERAAYRLAYQKPNAGYRLFKALVLAVTLVMPPRQFYRLKNWYSRKGLRRLRRVLGEPTPAAPIVEGRMQT